MHIYVYVYVNERADGSLKFLFSDSVNTTEIK